MASWRLSSLFQTWDKLNPNYMERSWSHNRTPSGQPDTPIPVVVWQVSGVFPPHPGDDCWWVLDLRSQAGKCGKLPKTNHSISKKLPLAGCLVILRKKISQFSSNFSVTAKKIWLSGAMFVASDQKWFAFRDVFLGDFIWFYHILSTSSSFIRVPLAASGQATLRRHRGEEKDLNFCIGVPVRHLGPKKGHGRNDHTSPRWDSLKIMVFNGFYC